MKTLYDLQKGGLKLTNHGIYWPRRGTSIWFKNWAQNKWISCHFLVLIWRNDLSISLKITLTGFLVLIWKLKKAWESGSILLQFIWIPNIMKLQMFSILITLMKKQRLKGTGKLHFLTMDVFNPKHFNEGKLHFLTMSCSLHFLSKYLLPQIFTHVYTHVFNHV